jgi:hypothetical protein
MRCRAFSSSLAALVAMLGVGAPAAALTLGFHCITNNLAGDCTIGGAQMSVDVTDPGSGRIAFTFRNVGAGASSITDVYWDDGSLLGIFSITNTPGLVQFTSPATPGNLPGGNNALPPFVATAGFSADSDSPVQPMGVNPGETLIVTFDLINGRSFADALSDLGDGELRIGIHVQGYGSGGSESFVNGSPPVVVPEPGTFALLGGGTLALTLSRRRR